MSRWGMGISACDEFAEVKDSEMAYADPVDLDPDEGLELDGAKDSYGNRVPVAVVSSVFLLFVRRIRCGKISLQNRPNDFRL